LSRVVSFATMTKMLECLLINLLLTVFLCSCLRPSEYVDRNYTLSELRLTKQGAIAYCSLLGMVLANVPSEDINQIGKHFYQKQAGPFSCWASFECMVPTDPDSMGSIISGNCQNNYTPGVSLKSNLFYALCENGSSNSTAGQECKKR